MVEYDNIIKAANRLRIAQDSKLPCEPVRDLIGKTDQLAAYSVQKLNSDLRIKSGAKVVGYKIGLTSEGVQQQLGVDQPDFGILFDDRQVANGGKVNLSEILQPKIEAEIAFILNMDLNDGDIEMEELIEAIDYASASLEIVGSRIKNWDISITDTIADNASGSHFVLGETKKQINEIDLVNCRMELLRNEELVSKGQGSECMDSPLNAALWVVKKMAELEIPLKAGDIILTGALGPMSSVAIGDVFKSRIEGLGEVKVTFV